MKVPIGLKKVASMCVLKHQDKFLLLKRANEPNKGMYVPVGGKLEPHENQIDACLRETFEETGIQLERAKFCGTLIESSPTKYNWISYIYIAEIEDRPPPYCEEGILEWIPIKDLLNIPTPPTDWWIYQYILKEKPFAFSADYDAEMNMLTLIEEIEGKDMKKQITKLYLNELTQQKMYKLFGLHKVARLPELDNWLSDLPALSEEEKIVAKIYQNRLIENIDVWNEQELSLGFIGPILNLVAFKIPYRLNLFAQRSISSKIGDYEIIGKPDGILASGFHEPEIPYFSFHEYKKEIDSNGDPAGQNLAAMYVGQSCNEENTIMYGCYVVGRNWFFMALKDKEYAISKDFSATDGDIHTIVQILKSLRNILFERLGIGES